MKTTSLTALMVALALTGADSAMYSQAASAPPRPQGPCDIYAAAGAPCVAAHSTTRALYASYSGPLYQVLRQSDGKTLDIGVVPSSATPMPDPGGYANAAAQDAFCANTYCWISIIYDQSPKQNHLVQAPRGGFAGPAMGGFNNLPVADMAPVTIMGHKVYGVFIEPGMGLRQNDVKGTAVDDQAEGQYWVINGHHYNSGCCFDYGNAETDSRDDGNGTMETTYYGNAPWWYRGSGPGPWIMTDQENNLVGCVNADGSKVCKDLPTITWRFVTAMAKGEPHHWTSLGGDAQRGTLKVMFDGPRIDHTYDPMRKQGAILLGNGGDNSVGSQGTFYEGAMTAPGTFPSDATDQRIQANVVAAKYDVARVSVAPASATAQLPGLQTFAPGSTRETTVTFTNTTGAPLSEVTIGLTVPKGWTASVAGTGKASSTVASVAPGALVSTTFKVTSNATPYNGDMVGRVSWKPAGGAVAQSETAVQKVRNVSAVTINEFRVSAGSPSNPTDTFIELYNGGTTTVDLSNWTLTQHQTQLPAFSAITIPAGTKLPAKGFYLLGLANSGLAVPARVGDKTIHVRSVAGLAVGDAITIGSGQSAETRTIAALGTAAGAPTPLWQPLPDGPVITMPVGSTNVPVTSIAGFEVGQKIGIGYGATYPTIAKATERYEVVTVTAVGKQGTQAFLAVDAAPGQTNIKVTAVADISAGDTIRMDVETVGYGIETVTVTKVGTAASRGALAADAPAGATSIVVRGRGPLTGYTVGDKMTVGTPANQQTVTITTVGTAGPTGTPVEFTPALAVNHLGREDVVAHGTGLDLTAPLKFKHAANMPFSARGTGLTFTPATAFAHSSNEPVLALGSGITLDRPLTRAHGIEEPVRNPKVTVAGYQGSPAPQQWFGGPALSNSAGAMILRNAAGLVVDSLNYGLLVDPWAAEGYQGESGFEKSGCLVPTPGVNAGGGPFAIAVTTNTPHRSAGRRADGTDTDSNCADFAVQAAAVLAAASPSGTTNVKVDNTTGFAAGQSVQVGVGANAETATIANVGTAGASTSSVATVAGAMAIPVTSTTGFVVGQVVAVGSGAQAETATVTAIGRAFGAPGGPRRGGTLTLAAPLKRGYAANTPVSGTGLTFTAPLTRAHGAATQIGAGVPTPGGPNKYTASR